MYALGTPRVPADPNASHVLALARRLVADPQIAFVAVRPAPHATEAHCFPSVDQQVSVHGGSCCHGRQLWERPGLMIEAEFHGVWRQPDETLLDITPKKDGERRILFVQDPERVYEGRQRNNVRLPLRSDPELLQWFAALDARYEFLNRGDRETQHGEIRLGPEERIEFDGIQARIAMTELALFAALSNGPRAKVGVNDRCPCGSGRKYKKCCARNIR